MPQTSENELDLGTVAVLALVAAACGGNSGQADPAGADQAPRASGKHFDAIDKAYFSTLGLMADAAKIVVLGEIVEVELGPILVQLGAMALQVLVVDGW